MNKYHKILLLVLLWITTISLAYGQRYQLPENPDEFVAGANLMLEGMRGEQAVFTRSNFDSIWVSIPGEHQKQIISIGRKMLNKKYPATPHFLNFFTTITNGYIQDKLSGSVWRNFYNVLDKSVEQNQPKEVNTFLTIALNLFNQQYLYASNFNSLQLNGGSFDFEYIESALPEANEQLPEANENEKQTGTFDDWDTNDNWNNDGWGNDNNTANDDGKNSSNTDGWGNKEDNTEAQSASDVFAQSEQALYEALTQTKPQPIVEGPVLHLKNVNFIFTTTYDSVGIKNTSGKLMLHKEIFVGKGGTFNWEMAGLDPNKVFVTFADYNFHIAKTRFEAEKVKLTYQGKIAEPAEGIFSFESRQHIGPEDAEFPRFKAYDNKVKVLDIAGKELSYTGGFSMRGNKILGASVIPGNSEIILNRDGQKVAKILSEFFVFADSTVSSKAAKVVLFHQRDSITHPQLQFRYYTNQKDLILRKNDGLYKNSPFWSSYFNMEISADLISWNIMKDSMDITTLNARNQIPARFTSKEYYNDVELAQITGMYGFNPLQMAVSYGRKIKKKEFYYTEMAEAYKQNPKVVKDAMTFLMTKGFVQLDQYGKVIIQEKAIHFVLSSFKRKDYDDIVFNSLTESASNATLNLENQELSIRGINRFYISRPLDVYIYPDSSTVTLLKNRDFKFNGQLYAGNFEFIGKDFIFRYDSFLVDMDQIDSIRFYIDVKDERTGEVSRQRVDNKLIGGGADSTSAKALSGLSTSFDGNSGTLYINVPNNKSGLREFPQYPTFDASRGAVVYFNNENVLDKAYDESVYFIIPPFKIDSLSGSDPATIGFEGTLVSGGILPDLKETLKIMPDKTLGFNHKIPEEGYSLYGGAAKIYNDLSLTGNGLNAQGSIDYFTTSLHAENFIFYPDSVTTTVGTSAVIKPGTLEGISFPEAKVDSFQMKWLPHQDSMYVSNFENNPFQFYNASASMYGTATITNNGVYGDGKLFTRGSESISKEMHFTETEYSAQHAEFKINSDNPSKPALAGDDIRLNFDLVNDEAEISPEIEGVAAIDFPYAQFKTSISQAVWNLDNRKITMTKPDNVVLENSYFYSTREELDSLAFNGSQAEYDIDSLKLYIQGIPNIKVADAMIIPEGNEITIYENSRIGTLTNTTLVIDTLNQYHTMIDGTIDIKSRTKFTGDASYQFVNARADTFRIKFGKFELVEDESRRRNRDLYTLSSGSVTEEDNLIISPGMIFKGQATMYAVKKPLELEGEVKLDFNNRENYNTWINYNSNEEQRTDIAFDFKSAETTTGEPLTAGLHFSQRDDSLYHTFITDKITPADNDFFIPNGILSYNFEKEYYQIVDTLKTTGENYAGKVFTYNENNGDITFEGPVKFVTNREAFQMQTAAIGKGNIYRGDYEANTFMALEIDMPSQASAAMATDIFDVVERLVLPEANDDQATLLYKAAEIIGENNAKEFEKRNQEEYVPLWGVSNNLIQNLVISNINLKYNSKHKAWYSDGKIGISNILRQDINAKVDGFLEMKKTEDGDMFNMFLQVSAGSWYHFSYYDNRLILSSSNPEFNDIVAGKTNVNKAKLGEYVFVPGDVAEALSYVNRFRKDYLGLDDPYNINMAAQQVEQPTDLLPQEVEDKGVTNETEGF